ncbi:hypothetical protein ACSBR2_015626 [Camellia fascicularis]
MFLSILTSRYAENDFVESLPFKLMIGLTTLFISITTMMVAFGATFFIVFDRYMVWVPIAVAYDFVYYPPISSFGRCDPFNLRFQVIVSAKETYALLA